MKSKWYKVMIPLLLLMLMAAQALALDTGSVTVAIPFTVEYASGTVVMEALNGAPSPETAELAAAQGSFEVTFTNPGNYQYRIFQRPGEDERIRYDQTVYQVTLFVMSDDDGRLSASVTVGTDGDAHKPESIAFVNEQKTGGLRITKTVKGSDGDTSREWHFTITLSDTADKLYSGVWFDTGVGHVTLRHGETVTLEGIMMGTRYKVTEDDADTDGYTTTFIGAEGVIGGEAVMNVAFVNEKGAAGESPTTTPSASGNASNSTPSTPKTGDETMLVVWAGLAGLSLAAIVVILLLGRKRRTDK